MTRICKFKMILIELFNPCKSVLSVLSVVRVWVLVQANNGLSRNDLRLSLQEHAYKFAEGNWSLPFGEEGVDKAAGFMGTF